MFGITRPSVDAIVATFNKTIEQLESAEDFLRDEGVRQEDAAQAAKAAAKAAFAEAERASNITAKLKALIS